MKRMLTCSLAVLIMASMATAALRARYFWAPNHIADGSSSGAPDAYKIETFQKVIPGIWDGWDDNEGFDNVSTKGDRSNAPWVTAEYWIDGVYEPQSDRLDAPLMEKWAVPSDMTDASYQLATDGYCVIAAGGLKVPQTGTYEFEINANDGGMVWIDKNGDGEIDLTSGDPNSMGTEIINVCADKAGNCGSINQLRCGTGSTTAWAYGYTTCEGTYEVELQQGLTKMMIWYWDWGEIGHYALKWKKPGAAAFEPLDGEDDALSLGDPKGGPPSVRITEVKVGDEVMPKTMWGNMDVGECEEVTFTVDALNMGDQTPVFIWDFYGNGSVIEETSQSTITYKYASGDNVFMVQPSVQVKRGETVSDPSSEKDVIFIWLADDPNVENCGVSVRNTVASSSIGTMKLAGTRLMVPATGRNVVQIYNAGGRQVRSLSPTTSIDLNDLNLTRGFYVVKMVRNGRQISSTPVLINAR